MRLTTKKILEIGIGYRIGMEHVEKIKGEYQKGASLYMWRDFFPNAQIFGADNDPRTFFHANRISTLFCDQTKKSDLKNLIKQIGNDIDIVIDDGSHNWQDQVFTCSNLMPLLQKHAYYIIEDTNNNDAIVKNLQDYICTIAPTRHKYRDDNLILVRNRLI